MNNKKNKKAWSRIVSRSIKIKNFTSNAKDNFSNFFELPQEIRKNSIKTTIIDDNNVLIEGTNKIADYYDDYIKIKGSKIDVIIDGKNLDIRELTDEEVIIIGQIYSINYKKIGVE